MIFFFKTPQQSVIATQVDHQLTQTEVQELCWLYGNAEPINAQTMEGFFVGPRREMVTPWSILHYLPFNHILLDIAFSHFLCQLIAVLYIGIAEVFHHAIAGGSGYALAYEGDVFGGTFA